jgi:hypothetical protein
VHPTCPWIVIVTLIERVAVLTDPQGVAHSHWRYCPQQQTSTVTTKVRARWSFFPLLLLQRETVSWCVLSLLRDTRHWA